MVISNKNKENHKVSFSFNGKKLENTTEFTYSRIKIHSTGSFKSTILDLISKAERAIFF